MSLNLIDIASWQAQIDLPTIFSHNNIDGVIVKATEGLGYVNPYCDKWVQWLIANNKPWGFYHFLHSQYPEEEAKYFVKNTINYFHDGIPVADYEGDAATYGPAYLKTFLDTVYKETGVKPMVYCNLSTIQGSVNGFRSIANAGYQLWLAQYASMNEQVGFNPTPWQIGSYEPFKKITMHQYSSTGILKGYTGHLDLDIFYGDRADWDTLAGKSAQPTPEPAPDPNYRIAKAISLLEEVLSLLKGGA